LKTDNVTYTSFSGWIDPPTGVLPTLTEDLTCDVAEPH
jgi:hypothetical protein